MTTDFTELQRDLTKAVEEFIVLIVKQDRELAELGLPVTARNPEPLRVGVKVLCGVDNEN